MKDQKVTSNPTKPSPSKVKTVQSSVAKPLVAKPALKTKVTPVRTAILKPLKEKLLTVIMRVLKGNNSVLTDKIQKAVNKSVKKIVKAADKQINKQ